MQIGQEHARFFRRFWFRPPASECNRHLLQPSEPLHKHAVASSQLGHSRHFAALAHDMHKTVPHMRPDYRLFAEQCKDDFS